MMNGEQLTQFLTHYGDNPFDRPAHRIPEFLRTVDECAWARTPEKQMSIAGAVSALMQLYPVDQNAWTVQFPDVFDMVIRVIRRHAAAGPDHPGWVALHLGRWFITRNPSEVDQILKLAGRGGEVGGVASTALDVASSEFPKFADQVKLLRRGQEVMVTLQ